jgi:general secretion pathway protein L
LAEIELAPDIVDVEGEDSRINLLPSDKRPRKGQLVQRLQWALGGLVLILLAVVCLLPLWQQRTVLVNDLLPRVNTAQRQVQEILALRDELESSIEASHFLLQKRRQTPLAIELLNELTRIFPDGTWVERLEIKGSEIQVRGQSSQASALIGMVEESKFFNNVTFRSPITADRRTGNDRFYLSAQFARES